ncbi:MFS transporter [Microvirga lotononidis]|uniref:Arabinose efflux permease family protein n=1 Tax=Microvirga lotononidis TaxID=864069 RepID=I4YWQ0_9HYPH|nr:MFS transporter [Microvirga lotononidis]EIM28392.1 arabinose efflux permease family protein [Microvirga lotononidis]WQO27524.1 MFS transporter [Microvirga lotononidis]
MADSVRPSPAPARVERPLDALNFFLADVRDGLGPYLAVYLLTIRHWNEAEIGLVMTMAGLAAIMAQTPAGALIDATHAKRAVIVVAALVVTAGSLLLPFLASFWPVAVSQAVVHATGTVFAPTIAAITLGIVGHAHFARRTGRNEAFNHAGNAFAAGAAGAAAYLWGPVVVFFLMAAMAIASLVSVLMVPASAINHEQARGLLDGAAAADDQPSGLKILVTCRPLLIFAASAVLFHLANAAMLPLVGQKLALQDKNLGTSLMSACIVAAQVVMVPMAMLVARKADIWGRKPMFLAGFLILPIRGVLYTLSDNPYWLVGVQLLDGIGAGLYGALFPLIVADLMAGTGRFNVAQGAVTTAQGIGASLSTALAGIIVVEIGYSMAFLVLAGIASAGLILFWAMMPETMHGAPGEPANHATIRLQPLPRETG